MKKILVLAYQISPTRGSEYSVAWNYVTEMSKENELFVIYGASGNHMGDFENFDKQIQRDNLSKVHFIPVNPNYYARLINNLNKKGWFPYAFYFAYRIWHWQVYKIVLDLMRKEEFDLIHFLNPIGFREPGYLWKINLPYIWGPISGTTNRPTQLFKALSPKERLFFKIRNHINEFQFKYNYRLRKALQNTTLLLTATTENQLNIENQYNKSSIYLPENGIISTNDSEKIRLINVKPENIINILWIGRIDANKSLNILLEALSKVSERNWTLQIIGEGPKRITMQKLSVRLGVDKQIKWHGQVPRARVIDLLQTGHLHIITSLGEGNPTTIWEAMANGIPTITLNHCGMKDIVCEKCGIKIDIDSYNQVIHDLAVNISDLLLNTYKINQLSNGVSQCIHKYTWIKRRELFNQFYQQVIKKWEIEKK